MSLQLHEGLADGGTICFTISPVESSEHVSGVDDMLRSFNHICRNTLNGIKVSLYLFKHEIGGPSPGSLAELERSYQQIEGLFDRLQMLYRPPSLTLIRAPLGRFFDECSRSWQSGFNVRGRKLEISPPATDLAGDFDPMFMRECMDSFVAWRAEASQSGTRAVLSLRITDCSLVLRWAERQGENAFLADGCANGMARKFDLNGGVDSLALLLLKRIILAHGGSLEMNCDPTFVMTLRWPRFQRVEPVKCGTAN